MPLCAIVGSPAVFHHPAFGFSGFVQVHGHQRHGMGTPAVETLDALFLVHAECGAKQAAIIVVVQVKRTVFGVQELAHVAAEIHHRAVFQAGHGHLLDFFNRKVHIEPIVSVIRMAVVVDFIHLVVRPRRVVHQHDIIGIQVLSAAHFLVETLRGIGLGLFRVFPVHFRCPCEGSRGFAVGIDQHAVNRFHQFHFLLFQFLFRSSLFGCCPQAHASFAQLAL